MSRYLGIIDTLSKPIRRLFLFPIKCGKAEFINRITVDYGLYALDYRVVAINSYSVVIVRNKKGENLSIKLFLALHKPKQFHDLSNSERYTIYILSICYIECGRTALHFAREERKVYILYIYKEGVIDKIANK